MKDRDDKGRWWGDENEEGIKDNNDREKGFKTK